jgi:protein TonB
MPSPGPISPFQITQERIPVNPGKGTKIPTSFAGFGKGDGEGPGAGIIGSAFLDNPPATRHQTPPTYPYAMKVSGVTGTVWVEFVVDENGRVHDVHVVKSTNDGFNEATVAAVATWRFEAGKRKGLPVRFRMTIPIVFSLND